jgi:hypothetical protein
LDFCFQISSLPSSLKMRAMTGEVRVMPLAFIAVRIFSGSFFSALAPPAIFSRFAPVQPAIASAAIINPARKNLAIIGLHIVFGFAGARREPADRFGSQSAAG